MNGFLALLGIESWKPALSVLVLPPIPFLLMILIGARLILPRRGLGWLVVLIGVAGVWLSSTVGMSRALTIWALKPPPVLTATDVAQLKDLAKARRPVALIVLGGGAESLAAEYGVSNLTPPSLERLRYGAWLRRETGLPLGYSGGRGWGAPDGQAEAQIAARIAMQDYNQPLKWVEDTSRDTRENAIRTIALLRAEGIEHIVIVTHQTHMPRSIRAFERAAAGQMRIQPAPMGVAGRPEWRVLDWFPSQQGYTRMFNVLHELLGLAAGV